MDNDFPQLRRLLDILRTLRGPDGCPWDRKQTLATAARYLTDEVHEYAEIADASRPAESRAELADLLYMVAFNWLLLAEHDDVAFDDLAAAGADKLVRRHPHVFGDDQARTVAESQELWNRAKEAEAGKDDAPGGALKDLAPSTSALRQAWTYGHTAADVGFDWDHPDQILAKVHEELGELAEARAQDDDDHVEEELGDVLFAVTQLARKLGVDPDRALRRTNRKFASRFRALEQELGPDPATLRALGVDRMMEAWEEIKRRRRERTD